MIIVVNDGSRTAVARSYALAVIPESSSTAGTEDMALRSRRIRHASTLNRVITDADGTYPNDGFWIGCGHASRHGGGRLWICQRSLFANPENSSGRPLCPVGWQGSIPDLNSGLRKVFRKECGGRFCRSLPDTFSFHDHPLAAMPTNHYVVY